MQQDAVGYVTRYNISMRYLVRGRVKAGREADLLEAIERHTLGRGSVAGDEYLRNMKDARLCGDQTTRWVEVVIAPVHYWKSDPTGRNFLISPAYKAPMIAAVAGTTMGRSPGHAAPAIARNGWSDV